jgi:hypothetical protein
MGKYLMTRVTPCPTHWCEVDGVIDKKCLVFSIFVDIHIAITQLNSAPSALAENKSEKLYLSVHTLLQDGRKCVGKSS